MSDPLSENLIRAAWSFGPIVPLLLGLFFYHEMRVSKLTTAMLDVVKNNTEALQGTSEALKNLNKSVEENSRSLGAMDKTIIEIRTIIRERLPRKDES